MTISKETKKELNGLLKTSFKALTESIKDVKSELPKVAHEIVLYEGIIGGIVEALEFFKKKLCRCCESCHQDADEFGYSLCELEVNGGYYEVCCKVNQQIQDNL